MGILSGYPIGAKIACDLRNNKLCTKEECERLLSFTNNSGPLFIIGTVGILMFRSAVIGVLLFISHILASLVVGVIFKYWKKNSSTIQSSTFSCKPNEDKQITLSNFGELLALSITNSISTLLLIGGFIVLFGCILSILNSSKLLILFTFPLLPLFNLFHISPDFLEGFVSGIFEITNGISLLSSVTSKTLSTNLIFTSFVLGFGGLSILLQVLSIVSKSDLSFKPYIYGKILQAIFSAIFTYLLIQLFPFFYFDL